MEIVKTGDINNVGASGFSIPKGKVMFFFQFR